MAVLSRVNSSADVKHLSQSELDELAKELRSEIIRICALGGGHLASSLGAVELTVALHALFDSRSDRLVWDVGHQSYGHKILTGRKDLMDSIRKPGGLAGFTCTSESPDDALTVGHASTSLAAALGMALARDASQERDASQTPYHVVAIIGDGALTGGMALAALNQIGHSKPKMLIILNDNDMSISENVGALKHYMSSLQVQPWFQKVESSGRNRLWKPLVDFGSRAKQATRHFFDPASANPFHAMGVRYVGPIDGHNIEQLLYYLGHIKELEGPTMLHIVTKKGKGYKIAETDPIYWHGPPKFDMDKPVAASKGYTWSHAFGDAASELAKTDDRVWVITPAMREGSGLVDYSQNHPKRYLDVGIAEDVSVTTAAGLALRGEKPIVAIYSTFLQRAYDQVIHDVCLENLDVIFAIDRAGLVGGDGATHQGVFDLGYLRTVPNMSIAMPKDAREQRAMLKRALELGGPKAIRWPRGKVEKAPADPIDTWDDIAWGTWEILKEGKDAFIFALGPTLNYALEAARELPSVGVINARFIKPLDMPMLLELARHAKVFVVSEDHAREGGLGSAIAEALLDNDVYVPLRRLGLPDCFVPHGDPVEQHAQFGIDAQGIRTALEELGMLHGIGLLN
ncbi:MAG: 1-deoxy-D-xylulose-5-phosphate synthase [Deinococcales bacterium]